MIRFLTAGVRGLEIGARLLGGFALVLLMALFCLDVISRYLFGRPIAGVYEITTTLLLPLVVFIGMAISVPHSSHVRLGALYDRLRGVPRRAVHVLSLLAGATFWGIITVAVGNRAIAAATAGQVSTVSFGLPIAWGYAVAAVGAALMTLISVLSVLLPEPVISTDEPAGLPAQEGV